jgi:nickel-dependent lactate racemase
MRDTRGDDYAGSDVQSIGVFEENGIQKTFKSGLHRTKNRNKYQNNLGEEFAHF